MAKPTGFMEYGRKLPSRRLVENRVTDWIEIYEDFPPMSLLHKTEPTRKEAGA